MAAGNNKNLGEKWLYSADITDGSIFKQRHPKSYQQIADIVKEEKCKGKTPFTKEKAIYLELVEFELAKGKRDMCPIVDFTFGIARNNSKKYRLIEAKFDVDDLKNIDEKNIRDKVSHSRDVMKEDGIPVDNGAVVLVNKSKIVEQQKNWFSRRLQPYGNYQIMTIDDLYSHFFVS